MLIREYRPAPLFRRLAAFVYDTFIIFSLIILATAFALIVNQGESFQSVQFIFLGYLFIIISLFFTWFWKRSGQTLGMLSWKLKLVDEQNQLLSWPLVWKRWLIAIPCTLTGISWIWCLFDGNKQSLHDRICKTQIIQYR